MSAAPDFLAPVVGYRAWHLEADGLLRPWTMTNLPWAAGVNRAVCARIGAHTPPVADCMCGIYALFDPADRRLNFRADQAVGAIAAWGDMEVHGTGFRAQQACVVALALPSRAAFEQRQALRRAAERYGVALVPARALSAHAKRHGEPLPADFMAPPVAPSPAWRAGVAPAAPPVDAGAFRQPARGIAIGEHVWVETSLGAVVLGVTRALGETLAPMAAGIPAPGARVRAGDTIASLPASGGTVAIVSPVSGTVLAVNPRLHEEPRLLASDPEGAGWLLRLAPAAWERDATDIAWGPAAGRHYTGLLARERARGDAFAGLRVERLRAQPPVRSAGDVLAALRRERTQPRFADAGDVAARLGAPIAAALRGDATLRARLARLGRVVRFELHEPAAILLLDLRDGAGSCRVTDATLATGDGPPLTVSCSAELAHAWFTGGLDVAAALRRGDLQSSAPTAATLRAFAVLKHLRVGAAAAR